MTLDEDALPCDFLLDGAAQMIDSARTAEAKWQRRNLELAEETLRAAYDEWKRLHNRYPEAEARLEPLARRAQILAGAITAMGVPVKLA